MWCNSIVVLLHACTDGSEKIIDQVSAGHPGRVHVIYESEATWNEMAHRQRMLEAARQIGSTHIAMVDFDEILSGNLLNYPLPLAPKPNSILRLPGYNLRGSLNRYHSNGVWANRWFSAAFSDHPALHWGGDQFHHREPMGLSLNVWQPVKQGDGGILHLWGASERRLRAKHAWYRITERLRWPNKPAAEIEATYRPATHGDWRGFADKWTFAAVPDSWWAPYAHLMQYVDLDAEPWQEAEIARAIETHGRAKFKGLDLLGY